MWIIGPLILFGIYCSPFLALLFPLASFYDKKAVYCHAAAILSLSFAFWFGIGGNMHQAAAVPVLLFMTGLAIQYRKFAFAWLLYVLQAAIVASILLTSAYYGLAPSVEVVRPGPIPMTPN